MFLIGGAFFSKLGNGLLSSLVKTDLNWSNRIFAFSLESLIRVPFLFSGATPNQICLQVIANLNNKNMYSMCASFCVSFCVRAYVFVCDHLSVYVFDSV